MAKARRKFGASQKDRIFLAALPDAATAANIYALAEKMKAEHGFTGTLILPEHLHVTLFHLGDWHALPNDVVKLANDASAKVSMPPFDVTFVRSESFPNRTGIYPTVLTCGKDISAWMLFHNTLRDALKVAGLGGATQGEFKPHITLVYDKVRTKPAPIAPITWTVREFVLIHSELGKTTHHHLSRWPLNG